MAATSPERQSRKRLATRQKISDAASRLLVQRGFDQVTVDEIAIAADVARVTVFNHFARKEDMFFDLDEQGREDLRSAMERRQAGTHVAQPWLAGSCIYHCLADSLSTRRRVR